MLAPRTPRFIAEVSSNHHRDLARCLKFIDTAKDIGCDAVKFQLFKIDQLFAPEVLAVSPEHRKRRDWELPLSFVPELAQRCRDKDIQFACTPFYLDAVGELEPYVDFYKIASYELLWDDLIIESAKTEKPLVLSTGMSDLDEIGHAVELVNMIGVRDITLLHCVSGYPTPIDECNLSAIQLLRETFKCKVGWSDHSVVPAVLYRAVYAWDATDVEFHLDIDGEGGEYQTGHCWLPNQIRTVIENIKSAALCDGFGAKVISKSEEADRNWRADPSDGLRPMKSVREQLTSTKV